MRIRLSLIYLTTLLCCSVNLTQAQSEKIGAEVSIVDCDSLQIQLKEIRKELNKIGAVDTKSQVDSLRELKSDKCKRSNIEFIIIEGRLKEFNKEYDEALNLYADALEYGKDEPYYQKTIANYKCKIFGKKLENEKAVEIANNAIKIPCLDNDKECWKSNADLIFRSAVCLQALNKTEQAVEKYEFLEKDTYGINDSTLKAGIYNQLGSIYFRKYQNDQGALGYFKSSLDMLPSKSKNRYFVYNNIANCYTNLENYDSTNYYFQKLINETDESRFLSYAYNGLGSMHDDLNNHNQAIKYYKLGLDNALKDKNRGSELIAKINLGKVYFKNDETKKAKSYLTHVINSELFPKLSGDRKYQAKLYSNLAEVQTYNSDLSSDLYKVFQTYDTIAIQRRTAEINKSVSKYEKLILRDSLAKEVLLKENEAEKVKNYRLSTALLVMSLLFLVGLAYQFRRLFMGQKQENDELVFQNNELQKVNQQLEQKTKSLSAKPKLAGEQKELSLKTKDKTYFIPLDKVTYVQAEDDGVRVYYDDTSKWTDVSLKIFHQELEDDSFVQIGKGVVVNVKHIAWINTNTLKMKAGAELKIGRIYKPKIKKILES